MDIANGIEKIKGGYSSNDAEFAKALYRLNALQWDDSSSEYNLNNDSKGFEKLEDQLSLGIPVVTTIDDTHTVNAIGLIQDSDSTENISFRYMTTTILGKQNSFISRSFRSASSR